MNIRLENLLESSFKRIIMRALETHALGSEHPYCDSIQMLLLILYFTVWIIDGLCHFIFKISSVITDFTSLSLLLLPAVLSFGFGIYLSLRSHGAVFGERVGQPELIDSGVYSLIRHPMYLGTLLFYLTFFFAIPSLSTLVIWIVFFIFYDKMATYEEKNLKRLFGKEYTAYQKRVPKWFPKISKNTNRN